MGQKKAETSSKCNFLNTISQKIKRLRHRKGHGVHSPFVYRIVREVFMPAARTQKVSTIEIVIEDKLFAFRDFLHKAALSKHKITELEALFRHLQCKTFSLDEQSGDMAIISYEFAKAMCEDEQIHLLSSARKLGTALVVLGSSESFCSWIEKHHSTSIDREEYLILFNNHLPKQHFVL